MKENDTLRLIRPYLMILFVVTTALCSQVGTTLAQGLKDRLVTEMIKIDSNLLNMYESRAGISERLNVKEIDLDGDKTPDLLVWGVLCGAANCPYYIFKQQGNHLTQIPSEAEGTFIRALSTRSHGWRDLVFAYHSARNKEPQSTYRFNGSTYVAR